MTQQNLSRRERQIMDALYQAGRASAAEIRGALPDAPSYSAVRTMLRILEEKGHVHHELDGLRYVYLPTVGRDKVKRSALRHLINTFFDGSTAQAMAALVELSPNDLKDEDATRLKRMIDAARKHKE